MSGTRLAGFALAALIAATPSGALAWDPVVTGAPVSMSKGGWSIVFPDGWLQDASAQSVIASRDGVLLNSIVLHVVPHKKAFAAAKRRSSADALPEDLAESYVADVQAQGGAREFEVLTTDPAELAGRPAFRVHVRYRLPESATGARIDQVTIGTALDAGLLLLTYRAPTLHHFERWLPAFEASVPTISYTPPQPKKR
jgi:hypothetical protein